MHGYLIDPWAKTITAVDAPDPDRDAIRNAITCPGMAPPGYLDKVTLFNGIDLLWLDDDGFNRPGLRAFYLKGHSSPLCGRGLVMGLDDAGRLSAPTISLAEVVRMVIWTGLETSGDREPDTQQIGIWHGKKALIHTIGGPKLRSAGG